MMYTLLGFLFMSFFAASFQDEVKISYKSIGCFRDSMVKPRPLPEMLKSFRGGRKDWSNFNDTIKACAELASKKGYLYFGLQYYGECWSGPQDNSSYDQDGPSKRCYLGVGQRRTNFVYMQSGKENECTDYHNLTSSDRSMTHKLSGHPKCDHWARNPSFKDDKRWYRFTGKAGQAMPETCVDPLSCQTLKSGWMDGKHPEVVDGIEDRRACFSWKNNCCHLSTKIRVRNCGKFYVYNLPSTKGCYHRYCGNGVTNSTSV